MSEKSALIIGHVQPPITDMVTEPEFIPRLQETITAARDAGVLVFFIHIGFDKNLSQLDMFIDGVSNPFHDTIAPTDKDVVIRGAHVSGFLGTDLDLSLRSQGIQRIVLTGISTGGVVLGTLTDAVQRGYGVTLLTDLAFDPNPAVHDAILKLVGSYGPGLPWGAALQTSAEWKAALS